MSIIRNNRRDATRFARLAAAMLFVLMVGMGYAISPCVEGAVESRATAQAQEITEPEFLPSDCAVDGLVFADCNFDF